MMIRIDKHFYGVLRINTSKEVGKGAEKKNRCFAASFVLASIVSSYPLDYPIDECCMDPDNEFTR